MENRREYIEKIAVRLKELDHEISELEMIADKAAEEVKAEYHQQIKELFFKKENLQNKITSIRETSGNAWEDIKAGAVLSWEVLNDSVKSRKRKPKQPQDKANS
jgi:hypothetical protein